MKKISLPKYHQLNASIRTIRDFCIDKKTCDDCPFYIDYSYCKLHSNYPCDWKELPKEVLDKE